MEKNRCPKCGSKVLIPFTDKIFCIGCDWIGTSDDLDDDKKYTIKQRKVKLKNLRNLKNYVDTLKFSMWTRT